MSSVITISQPPSVPGDRKKVEVPTEMTFAPMDPDADPMELEMIAEHDIARVDTSESEDGGRTDTSSPEPSLASPLPEVVALARDNSLAKLQGANDNSEADNRQSKQNSVEARMPEKKAALRRRIMSGPDAVIVLKEERVSQLLPFAFGDSYSANRRVHSMTFSSLYTLSTN